MYSLKHEYTFTFSAPCAESPLFYPKGLGGDCGTDGRFCPPECDFATMLGRLRVNPELHFSRRIWGNAEQYITYYPEAAMNPNAIRWNYDEFGEVRGESVGEFMIRNEYGQEFLYAAYAQDLFADDWFEVPPFSGDAGDLDEPVEEPTND